MTRGWTIRGRLPLLAALLFFSVQMLALAHNAQHGFAEHRHAGVACAIHHYAAHQQLLDAAPVSLATPCPLTVARAASMAVVTASPAPVYRASPRAPPRA